jgi:hypothetical protein
VPEDGVEPSCPRGAGDFESFTRIECLFLIELMTTPTK